MDVDLLNSQPFSADRFESVVTSDCWSRPLGGLASIPRRVRKAEGGLPLIAISTALGPRVRTDIATVTGRGCD